MSYRYQARRWAAVVVAACVLALATACADDPVQDGAKRWTPPTATPTATPADASTWTGRVSVDRDTGAISAPGFNEVVETARPAWARSLDTAAAELLNLNRGFDGPVEIYLLTDDDKVATFTLTKLGDDSVEAERYRVEFDRGDDGLYRFVSGERTMKCQSGRGHQDFDLAWCS